MKRNHQYEKGGQSKIIEAFPHVDSIRKGTRSPKLTKQIEITSFFSRGESESRQNLVLEGKSSRTELNSRAEQQVEKANLSRSESNFSCMKCTKRFPLKSLLIQHIVSLHYAEQLLQVYPGQACPFSGCKHTAHSHMLKLEHIALCHQSAVNFLLQKEGHSPLKPCPTDNFLPSISPCQLCSQSASSAPSLAVHYMTVHYHDRVDTEDTSHCQVCGAVFHAGTEASRGRLLQHLALRHTGLLVCLMERDG